MLTAVDTVVYTIGYEGVAIDTFLRKLKASKIKRVIDVRRNPISRKPGFSKRRLQEELATIGVEYVHIPQLGIPSSMRRELHSLEDYKSLFDEYEKTILPDAQEYKEHAIQLLTEKPSALLCFESTPCYCHRSRLAGVIANETGFVQKHIQFD